MSSRISRWATQTEYGGRDLSNGTLSNTLEHLLHYVLPAAAEYEAGEDSLSRAYTAGASTEEAKVAKRKAAELAVAIDGLTDRVILELKTSPEKVRGAVSKLCVFPGTETLRAEAFERVHSVANVYKHSVLTNKIHVINSFEDVLVVGLGFGLDAFGVGKYGGVEVLVKDKQGRLRKFLGDAPTVINAWFCFLRDSGAVLPQQTYIVCGVQIST